MTEDSEPVVKEEKRSSKSESGSGSSKPTTKTSSSPTSQKKDRSRETQPTRIVIRHLPPTMTSEEFLEAISPIADYNDYYFCRAERSLGSFAFCRAYINFIHMEDVFIFKDKFDGYVFVDSKGNEFPAIVEFAPFQRIFRRRIGTNGQLVTAKKRDNKSGTIDQDPEYLLFLEELEKMKTEANMPSADVYLEEIEAREKQIKANHGVIKMTTPLIEFVKNKKLEKIKLREERREERRRKQLEQKKLKEEEQNKKMKLLSKASDDKTGKDSETKAKDREKEDKPKSSERVDKNKSSDKSKAKDSERKGKSYSKTYEKRSDSRKVDKKQNTSHKSEPKEPKEKSKEKDSTFVVKVVRNTDEKKQNTDTTSSEAKSQKAKEEVTKDRTDHKKERHEKSESSGKDRTDSSAKAEAKRIRNKDRPTREIYRPGAKRQTSSETTQSQSQSGSKTSNEHKSGDKPESSGAGYKQRVFTRSKP